MKGVILLAPILGASLVVAGLTRAEDATVNPSENAHDRIVIDVSAGNGTFSVHAENAPFADILDRLAAAAGFSVKTQLDFSGHLVTIELDNVPWLQGLPQLLQGWSYSLAMNQSMNRPEMLHILAVSEAMPMEKEERAGFVPEIERDEAAERERSPAERLAEAIKIDRIYNIAASDSDPQVRRDALEVYVRYGNRDEVLWVVQSLARKEGPTRDIAVREWIRIEQEMMEADLSEQQVEEAMQQ